MRQTRFALPARLVPDGKYISIKFMAERRVASRRETAHPNLSNYLLLRALSRLTASAPCAAVCVVRDRDYYDIFLASYFRDRSRLYSHNAVHPSDRDVISPASAPRDFPSVAKHLTFRFAHTPAADHERVWKIQYKSYLFIVAVDNARARAHSRPIFHAGGSNRRVFRKRALVEMDGIFPR